MPDLKFHPNLEEVLGCHNSRLFVFQLDDTDDEDQPVCCSRTISCELNLTTSLIPRPQGKWPGIYCLHMQNSSVVLSRYVIICNR